ncbi:MAG: hypothetical protein C5B59_06895 [Bacteroidetes bacterium]|nr:MAG: hypothetical protein C5B59_06895 [Bacteroidota bacterium]
MRHIDFVGISSIAWTILLLYWVYTGMKTKITVKRQATLPRVVYLAIMITGFSFVFGKFMSIGWLGSKFLPPLKWLPYLGLLINLAGIILAIVARAWLGNNWSGIVTIKKDHELIRSGPYSITRHPIYTGLLFGLFGVAIIIGEWRALLGVLILFFAIQLKIKAEEKMLSNEFPEYREYKRQTKKLIPLIY